MVSYAQKVDANDDCILKYNHSIFNLNERHTIPITIFYYPNGNFFVKNDHIDRVYESEDVYYRFYEKGKLIKLCFEKYATLNDSDYIFQYNNYFPHYEYKEDSSHTSRLVLENSIILHNLNEQELFLSNGLNAIRIIYLCSEYSNGMFEGTPVQYFNVLRVDLSKDSSKLIYKSGHFREKGDFIIDINHCLFLSKKDIRSIEKTIDALLVGNTENCNTDNANILYELYLDGKYYVTFQDRFHHDRNKVTRDYFGLYVKLISMVSKKTKKTINVCD